MAKENDLVTKMWGKHAHVSEVVDKESTPSEIKRLIKVTQSHTNYQCSMILEDIIRITNFDATAPIFDEESNKFLGNLSLHQVLLLVISGLVMATSLLLRCINLRKLWAQSKRSFPTLPKLRE